MSGQPDPQVSTKVQQTEHLVLFMTRGMCLADWDRLGMFDRETALYRALRPQLGGIAIVTYGGRGELAFGERLPGIDILCNRWGLPLRVYERLIPWLHASSLRRVGALKTNQTNGAEIALAAARLHHKPLIARCGYMWSEFVANGAESSHRLEKVRQIERAVFTAADRVVVTTQAMRETVSRQYGVPAGRVSVIPNYVRADRFRPQPERREEGLVCFAGRLQAQKNPLALVDAMEGLSARLLIIGQGELRGELEQRAYQKSVNVQFAGQVDHELLPDYLARASLFVLPSHYEGHPKTLLEAMSCGLPVIGADSPGIHEVIRHGETGYLCSSDPYSIRSAIEHVMADADLRARLSRGARQFVLDQFALERIVQMELDVLTRVVG